MNNGKRQSLLPPKIVLARRVFIFELGAYFLMTVMKSSWVYVSVPSFGGYSGSVFQVYWHPYLFLRKRQHIFQISFLSNILEKITMNKRQSDPCIEDMQACRSSAEGSGPTVSPSDFWKSLEGECKSLPVPSQCERREPPHLSRLKKDLSLREAPITYSLVRKFHFHVLLFFYSSLPEHLVVKVLASWDLTWKSIVTNTIYIVAIRFPGCSSYCLQTQSPQRPSYPIMDLIYRTFSFNCIVN